MSKSGKRISYSKRDLKEIDSIQFGLLSPSLLQEISVVEVKNHLTYKNNKNFGINDIRMGPMELNKICETCKCSHFECPGHYGLIKLAKPVFHTGFFNMCLKVLKCVCIKCHKLLLKDYIDEFEEIKMIKNNKVRQKKIFELFSKKDGIQCGKIHKMKKIITNNEIKNKNKENDNEITNNQSKKKNKGRKNKKKKSNNKEKEEQKENHNINMNNINNNYFNEEKEDIFDKNFGCGTIQPKYQKDETTSMKIFIDYSKKSFNNYNDNKNSSLQEEEQGEEKEKFRELLPEEVLQIFAGISNEDCELLGFDPKYSRPDWMIIQNLIVPPPQMRPSTLHSLDKRQEDSLTYQYNTILKKNRIFNEEQSHFKKNNLSLSKNFEDLQNSVNALFKNKFSLLNQEKIKKTLTDRLGGKEGRIRGNLMGKRVDFSARTVISPDPSISLDEVGVPVLVAMTLTFPEVVTKENKNRLEKLITNGPTRYPGANSIILPEGMIIDLKHSKRITDEHLDIGYIVERHLQNGDYVLLNRQPSLHKMSMMGHRVRVLPYNTFRLNLSVTTPYNADFDGDEMNLHFPQSYECISELKHLMHISKQIISPKSNSPIMGLLQDALIGTKLFTSRDTFLSLDEVMSIFFLVKDFDFDQKKLPIPCIMKPKLLWSGKQILSLIFPSQLNISGNNESFIYENKDNLNVSEDFNQIVKGELIQGVLDKNTLGDINGGIVHLINNEFGSEKTINFLFNCQKIVNHFLLKNGFTVGISDVLCNQETSKEISKELIKMKQKILSNIHKAETGDLIPELQSNNNKKEPFELLTNTELNNACNTIGLIVQKSLNPKNHLNEMITSGSKGKLTNISQIMGIIGQQNLEGKRIPFLFNKRTLPHFLKDDYGTESRGFVENSFVKGLSPQEFFFHSMCGREGIIDTAVKTSKTGYLSRKLVKCLEDIMVNYDNTVRDSMGNVIQFLYGEDGMSYEFIENQKFLTINLSDYDLNKNYKFFDFFLDKNYELFDENKVKNIYEDLSKYLQDKVINEIKNEGLIKLINDLDNEFEKIKNDRDKLLLNKNDIFIYGDNSIKLPININTLIENTKTLFNINEYTKSDLNPFYLLEKVSSLINNLSLIKGSSPLIISQNQHSLELLSSFLSYSLSSKELLKHHRLTKESFDYLLNQIKTKFEKSKVAPGEMVGCISAESLSEPATQMTLNTFHMAGISSVNVTLGIPRLSEIFDISKNNQTPSMTIFLKPNIEKSVDEIMKVKNKIEKNTLMSIIKKTEIFYAPNINDTFIESDRGWFEKVMENLDEENESSRERKNFISPWLLRIELDQEICFKKFGNNFNVMEIIKNKIIKEVSSKLFIISTVDSDIDNRIIYIRIDASSFSLSSKEKKDKKGKSNKNSKNNKNNEEEENIKTLLSYDSIKCLETIIVNLIKIDGINSIEKVSKINQSNSTILETVGSSLSKVFEIEEIDSKKTFTNNINEVNKILGIEAVRKVLIKEIRKVFDNYGIYINYRHICLLSDFMTQRGYLTPINRYGIKKTEFSPLRKASFEEVSKIFIKAGILAEKDQLKGISENILVGKKSKIGTGNFDVFFEINEFYHILLNKRNLNLYKDNNTMNFPSNTEYAPWTLNPYNDSLYTKFSSIGNKDNNNSKNNSNNYDNNNNDDEDDDLDINSIDRELLFSPRPEKKSPLYKGPSFYLTYQQIPPDSNYNPNVEEYKIRSFPLSTVFASPNINKNNNLSNNPETNNLTTQYISSSIPKLKENGKNFQSRYTPVSPSYNPLSSIFNNNKNNDDGNYQKSPFYKPNINNRNNDDSDSHSNPDNSSINKNESNEENESSEDNNDNENEEKNEESEDDNDELD